MNEIEGYEVKRHFTKVEKAGKKKKKRIKKAEKARQSKNLITSSSHIQILKEKIRKKADKESFLVRKT